MHRLFWLFGVAACLHGVPDNLPEEKPAKRGPEPVVPAEESIAEMDRKPGPLALHEPERIDVLRAASQRDQERWISSGDMTAELHELRELITTFYPGAEVQNFPEPHLKPTESWTVMGFAGSMQTVTSSLGICVRPALADVSCNSREKPLVPNTDPPFELSDVTPEIVKFVVRDLDGDARWSELGAEQLARLKAAHGIILDVHEAHGSDPRPLLPWLEQVTGRAPLRPLRAIVRSEDAAQPVAAYDDRFLAPQRDRQVWASLVGTMPAAKPHATPVIEVITGQGCESACELALRVLQTYAGATVYGAVGAVGRLDRDEPARVVLPHSRLALYFFATAYVLGDAIETATGPTGKWKQQHQAYDTDDKLVRVFAVRDIEQRARGGWPRCEHLPYIQEPSKVSAELAKKLPNVARWNTCKSGQVIEIRADAPSGAVQQLVDSCNLPGLQVGGNNGRYTVYASRQVPFGVIAQLAESPLVETVSIDCIQEVYLD